MAAPYGGGFGQGLSHKTAKVQHSSAQLSGASLWEICTLCYLEGRACINKKGPEPQPSYKQGEGFSSILPIPPLAGSETSESPFPVSA